jgi:hypothetical protein
MKEPKLNELEIDRKGTKQNRRKMDDEIAISALFQDQQTR